METEMQGDAEIGGGGHEWGRGWGTEAEGGRKDPSRSLRRQPGPTHTLTLACGSPELCVNSVCSLDMTRVWSVFAKPRNQGGDRRVLGPFCAGCGHRRPKTPQREGWPWTAPLTLPAPARQAEGWTEAVAGRPAGCSCLALSPLMVLGVISSRADLWLRVESRTCFRF